jgi:hypothetical protein
MALQSRQHIGEPGQGIDVVELGGLDQRVDCSGAAAAGIGAVEGPVVTSDGEAAQCPLGSVIAGTEAAASRKRSSASQQVRL